MKRFKFLPLLIALFAVCAFSAISSAGELPDRVYSPHADTVQVLGDKIYVLFSTEYHEGLNYDYKASTIVEFDFDLNVIRSADLTNAAGAVGKNAAGMAMYGGKLYVYCLGGMQGAGYWGDIWEVDTSTMTAKQALNVKDVPGFATTPATPYSVSIAPDGTAYCLIGYYDANWAFTPKLYVSTAEKISRGDIGTEAPGTTNTSGYSWNLAYDDASQILWFVTGNQIEARSKDGTLLRPPFTPAALGNNASSISVWKSGGGIFYTAVASDYTSASIGTISSDFTVNDDLVAGLASDTQVFAFFDHGGNSRALVREYHYGPNDTVYVYDPSNWGNPIKNVSNWASNIHNLATSGDYMFLTSYESYGTDRTIQAPGEVVRVNMRNDSYTPDKRYSAAAIVVPQQVKAPEIIMIDLPAGSPSNVHSVDAEPVSSLTAISIAGINDTNMDTDKDGNYFLKPSVAKTLARSVWNEPIGDVTPLPVFTATVASKDIAAVFFNKLNSTSLLASSPESVKVMKFKGEASVPFTYVDKAGDFADGTFSVMKGGNLYTEAITATDEYTLVLFIGDNGDKSFDLDPAEAMILDPAVIVGTAASDGGGSGGGCDASGASLLGVFAVLSLAGVSRKCRGKK